MANSLRDFMDEYDAKKYAVDAGTQFHEKLRRVRTLDDCVKVDCELKTRLESVPGLGVFFTQNAQTEVPIAGIINDVFVSRRIDRLVVDDENKIVRILDYKSDTDKTLFHDKYIHQLAEYKKLVQQIYPGHIVKTFILWLHDWTLEQL